MRQLAVSRLHRLTLAIGATLGIEAFAWLTDIAKVPREEAAAILRSNALCLLRAAIAEHHSAANPSQSQGA